MTFIFESLIFLKKTYFGRVKLSHYNLITYILNFFQIVRFHFLISDELLGETYLFDPLPPIAVGVGTIPSTSLAVPTNAQADAELSTLQTQKKISNNSNMNTILNMKRKTSFPMEYVSSLL